MSDSQTYVIAVMALVIAAVAVFAFLALYRRVEKNPFEEIFDDDFDKRFAQDTSKSAATVSAPSAVDDTELIAVFAAVAAYYDGSGVDYNIKSVRPAGVKNRSVWAAAGLMDNVRPF